MKQLAQEIQKKNRLLSEVHYFIGLSRIGSAAGRFGFDTFPLSDDVQREHQSHKLAEKANVQSGMDRGRAREQARKRPATLAVISAKKLVELYGD